MTSILAAIGLAIKEHWPKIIIAVLCAFVVAAVAKCEREEVRQDETLVQTGRDNVVIEHQKGVIEDVQTYQNAVQHNDTGAIGSVRAESDRCTRNPASCQ